MSKYDARKILVADNDEDVLVALERVLEDDGYATTTAISSVETCELLPAVDLICWCWTIRCRTRTRFKFWPNAGGRASRY